MSVQSKMTAIASGLRTLSGTENKMGLDAMNSHVATANNTVDTQTGLISQIRSALNGKAASGNGKPGQEKDFDTDENGVFEIEPDDGYVLTKVTMTVDVPEEKPEQEKSIEIDSNCSRRVEPDEGYALSGVDVTVSVPSDMKPEEEKYVTTTQNGVFEILPDAGKVMSKVIATVDVPEEKPEQTKEITAQTNGTFVIEPDDGYVMTKVITNVNVPSSGAADDTVLKGVIDRSITALTVPAGTKIIGDYVFRNCEYLSDVILPEGLEKIGQYSFYNDWSLCQLVIPASVKNIENYAFYGCFADPPMNEGDPLTAVTFKGTPDYISSNAFNRCMALSDIFVPWSSGAVAGAPWGATSATVHYNSEV